MPEISWFTPDVYKLLLRLSINIVSVTIIVRLLYYPNNPKKSYIFTYYLIGFITFFLCFCLKKLDIDTGMGLGLFAILGIIRYRTDTIEIKEMTYLFTVIGLSVINSLAANKISLVELSIVNSFTIGLIFLFEYFWLPQKKLQQTTIVTSINSIQSFQTDQLIADLEDRTGLKIVHLKIGKINYSNKNVQIIISYTQ
ncbi:DUF4956 domain-containing protein [Aureispira anguillae]|uniref:DUF4956 domain-containing protein n=1 Tax=Aureispira anguillae TaxID=2864201 RepID=A0A915YC59_9BACT|nr:DUF4956 domain-containing protein [Aureispira anguillae]BDS10379.1 DUF4956 domain-containing protein [Aureispira anguillae]